jgi:hypothetical protein
MNNQKNKSRLAWKIWNLLNECNDILWNLYEEEFLDFCMEDCSHDPLYNYDDKDNSIFKTESEFIHHSE